MAFARYSRDRSFEVLHANKGFALAMAAGSIIGTILGGLLLCAVPEDVLIPLPAGRAPPRVFDQGLAPGLTIKSLSPRCSLSPRVASSTRRAEPSSWPRKADDPPRDVDLTADRRLQCLRLM